MSLYNKESRTRGTGSTRVFRGRGDDPKPSSVEDSLRITVPNVSTDIASQPIFDNFTSGDKQSDSTNRASSQGRSDAQKPAVGDESLRITFENERFRDARAEQVRKTTPDAKTNSPSETRKSNREKDYRESREDRSRDRRKDSKERDTRSGRHRDSRRNERSRGDRSFTEERRQSSRERNQRSDRHEERSSRTYDNRSESSGTNGRGTSESDGKRAGAGQRGGNSKDIPRNSGENNDPVTLPGPGQRYPETYSCRDRSAATSDRDDCAAGSQQGAFTQDVDYRAGAPTEKVDAKVSLQRASDQLQSEIQNILMQNPGGQKKGLADMANALKDAFRGTQWENKLHNAVDEVLTTNAPLPHVKEPHPSPLAAALHQQKMSAGGWAQISEPPPPETKPKKSILKKSAPDKPPEARGFGLDEPQYSSPSNFDPHRNLRQPLQPDLSRSSFGPPQDLHNPPNRDSPSLSGLQTFMNAEDEDRFLYGDEPAAPSVSSRQIKSMSNVDELGRGTPQSYNKDAGNTYPFMTADLRTREQFPGNSIKSGSIGDIQNLLKNVPLSALLRQQPQKPGKPEVSSLGANVIDYAHKGLQQQNPSTIIPSTYSREAETFDMIYDRYSETKTPRHPRETLVQHSRDLNDEKCHSAFQNPEAPDINPATSEPEKKLTHDPTIANILKSIGFDFEMSKNMQEKAQQQRGTPVDENTPEALGILPGSSFMGGGMTEFDIQGVFAGELKADSAQTDEKSAKGNTLSTEAELSYEERARRYREELQKKETRKTQKKDQIDKIKSPLPENTLLKLRENYEEPLSSDDEKHLKKKKYRRRSSSSSSSSSSSVESDRKSSKTRSRKRTRTNSGSIGEPDSGTCERNYSKYYAQYGPTMGQPAGVYPPGPYGQTTYGMPPMMFPAYHPPPGIRGPPPPWYRPGAPYRMNRPPLGQDHGNAPKSKEDIEWERLTEEFIKKGGNEADDKEKGSQAAKLKEDKKDNRDRIKKKNIKKEDRRTDDRKEKSSSITSRKDKDTVTSSTEKTSKRTVLPPKAKKAETSKPEESRKIISIRKDTSKEVEKKTKETFKISPEQREAMRREMEERQQRLNVLEKEMERLRKQQNELMRKKQRERDGHKDPMIVENSKLQDEIATQISLLRKTAAENASTVLSKDTSSPITDTIRIKVETDSDQTIERRIIHVGSFDKKQTQVKSERVEKTEIELEKKEGYNYEYYDPGNHWCPKCNQVYADASEFFEHLHEPKHRATLDVNEIPWENPSEKKKTKKNSTRSPFKGLEFLMPSSAIYCTICQEFSGDKKSAEEHLKSDEHNSKYRDFLKENPFYEKRFYLDKAAGLARMNRSVNDDLKEKVIKPEERRSPSLENERKRQRRSDSRERRRGSNDEIDTHSKSLKPQYKDSPTMSRTQRRDSLSTSKSHRRDSRDRESPPSGRSRSRDSPSNVKSRTRNSSPSSRRSYEREDRDGKRKTDYSRDETKRKEPSKSKNPPMIGKMPSVAKRKGALQTNQGPARKECRFFTMKTDVDDNKAKPALLDKFLTIGSEGVPVIDRAKPPAPLLNFQEVEDPKYRETNEDLKLLGIEPSSEKRIVPRPPPSLAAQNVKPSAGMSSSSATGLYNVFFSNKNQSKHEDRSAGARPTEIVSKRERDSRLQEAETSAKGDVLSDGSEVMMDMGSDFEILDECE